MDLYRSAERLTHPPRSSRWRAKSRHPRFVLPHAAKSRMPTPIFIGAGLRRHDARGPVVRQSFRRLVSEVQRDAARLAFESSKLFGVRCWGVVRKKAKCLTSRVNDLEGDLTWYFP
jgi:hypothetical protein